MDRALHAALALILLFVLAPVMLVLWALVRLDGGPALDAALCVGRRGRTFRKLRYRTTMPGVMIGAHASATAVGRWLRATGLDALPCLFNVLRGDASLSLLTDRGLAVGSGRSR
jgi:undecaprenyl-phosphate galactose phosphotransferase